MIKRYNEYINESLEFILESNVEFSTVFLNVLNKIDNVIAKKLISIYGKDLDVTSNYIDIDKTKNDTVSFIADRRAQQIISDSEILYRFIGSGGGWLTHGERNKGIFDKLGYTFEEGSSPFVPNGSQLGKEVSRTISSTSGRVYILLEFDSGQRGVYNLEKLRIMDEKLTKLWSTGRQEIKVGRIARALLTTAKIDFIDREIELFVNDYKAAIDKFNDKFSYFDEVSGSSIIHWYDECNYYESDGTLGNSCMAGMGSDVLGIYEDSENISMLIYKSSDDETKILGRAILWKLVSGERYLDRIYTINDSDVNLFREYAKENNIYTKRDNNSSNIGDAYKPDGSGTVELNLVCQIETGLDSFPYMDTLKYYCPETGLIANKIRFARNGADDDSLVYECESTEGGTSDEYD